MSLRHLLLAGAVLAAVSLVAAARGPVGFGIPAPVYTARAPVYYAPAPAYYPPVPAYYAQASSYSQPPPAYYYPPAFRAAPLVVYAPRAAWHPPSQYVAYRPHHGPGRAYGARR